MARNHLYHNEFFERLRQHPLGEKEWVRQLVGIHTSADQAPSRYARFFERERKSLPSNAWAVTATGTYRAGQHYKGLFNCKTPFDLSLYTMLLWELRPKTIIELGSFQGGSALWFADQLSLVGGGVVHSFERFSELVSDRAEHPMLTFHRADLSDLTALDAGLFQRLEHPWLVVDDAHANICGVMRFLDPFMHIGDYYVIEDILCDFNGARYDEIGQTVEALNFMVDTAYTDNFGVNLTCAPNGWLRKMGQEAGR
jgi:cephalosporin hydroxylase